MTIDAFLNLLNALNVEDINKRMSKWDSFVKGKLEVEISYKELIAISDACDEKILLSKLDESTQNIFRNFSKQFNEANVDKRKKIEELLKVIRSKFDSDNLDLNKVIFTYKQYSEFQNIVQRIHFFVYKLNNAAKRLTEEKELERKMKQVLELEKIILKNDQKSKYIKDDKKERELRQFAAAGNFDQVQNILKQNINPDAKGKNSENAALHEVIINLAKKNLSLQHAIDIIGLMSSYGADINVRDKMDNTPFILAMKLLTDKEQSNQIGRKLQSLGADTALKNAERKTGIDYINQPQIQAETSLEGPSF